MRSRGVGVYFLIHGGVGVYFSIFGGVRVGAGVYLVMFGGAEVYNFQTPEVGVYFILATPQPCTELIFFAYAQINTSL